MDSRLEEDLARMEPEPRPPRDVGHSGLKAVEKISSGYSLLGADLGHNGVLSRRSLALDENSM